MAFLQTLDGRKKTANSGELELLEVPSILAYLSGGFFVNKKVLQSFVNENGDC